MFETGCNTQHFKITRAKAYLAEIASPVPNGYAVDPILKVVSKPIEPDEEELRR